MAQHERFAFRSIEELRAKIESLGLDIRLQEDLSPLRRVVEIGALRAPNSLGIHPMEGCDGEKDGSPSELTLRRYKRFASGGAGVLWFEATAVVPDGRGNARQLWLHKDNVDRYTQLVEQVSTISGDAFGPQGHPLTILQLTHSGRYSRPCDRPAPVIAFHHPVLDPPMHLPPDFPVISDEELEALEDRFVDAALLANKAGFSGVDIKSVHGYLCAELLAGHTRTGRYGGTFENRTRFLTNIVDKVREAAPDLILAVRLTASDCLQYPHSWGTSKRHPGQEDTREPIRLARLLLSKGVRLLNVTAGSPYYNPHVARPFDVRSRSMPVPPEHPLESVARLFNLARDIQQAVPKMVVMGTGYSWLRQLFPCAAAANLDSGWVKVAGLGREALAYPHFARDLIQRGALEPRSICITCSKCTQLMRDNSVTGCVTRDSSVYAPIYREACLHRVECD